MLTIKKKTQNIIGSGNIKKKNLQCLQPRKGRKLNMNANAKLGTGELVCFTLAFTNFLGPDHSLGFLVSPLEYAFTALHTCML